MNLLGLYVLVVSIANLALIICIVLLGLYALRLERRLADLGVWSDAVRKVLRRVMERIQTLEVASKIRVGETESVSDFAIATLDE